MIITRTYRALKVFNAIAIYRIPICIDRKAILFSVFSPDVEKQIGNLGQIFEGIGQNCGRIEIFVILQSKGRLSFVMPSSNF